MQIIDITPKPTPTRTPRRHSMMPPNSPPTTRRASQRAALRRLQRAQLAEARRIRLAVADAYRLTPTHLRCPRRPTLLAEARQVAMWLMRTRLRWPLPARTTAFPCTRIGRLLGGRDHATVMHGVALITVRLASGRQEDTYLRQIVSALGATLDATYEARGRRHGRAA
jgi:chromosomal replication initiation ATPase DnaA